MRIFIVVTGLVLGWYSTIQAAPKCSDIASCERACQGGKGDLAACRIGAELIGAGAGDTTPNMARKAELLSLACGEHAAPIERTTVEDDGARISTIEPAGGDAEACLSLAKLVKTGWLFEVERDFGRSRQLLDRAQMLASKHCSATDTTGCALAARAAAERAPFLVKGSLAGKVSVTDITRMAELGCKARDLDACEVIWDNMFRWQSLELTDDKEHQRLRALIRSASLEACTRDAVGKACYLFVDGPTSGLPKAELPKIRAGAERACAANDPLGCLAKAILLVVDGTGDTAKLAQASELVVSSCSGRGHEVCEDMARALAEKGIPQANLKPDAKLALSILKRRCAAGSQKACERAANLLAAGGPGLAPDKARASEVAARACMLTAPDDECQLCKDNPKHALCTLRVTYEEHAACFAGRKGMCEVVGRRFRDGTGVKRDAVAAATHFRRGCDAAEKSSCAALDELCIADRGFDRGLCHQSLIHSDLFYEAEWQFRTTGIAKIAGDSDKSAPSVGAVAVADASGVASASVAVERGRLDADLVVNVVLDRARQAAIALVVDELSRVGAGARSRYLQDLLAQGSALLADPTTLRREKFQDLGMTVVRAFVASNLVDTLFPTPAELFAAPVVGPLVKQHARDLRIVENSRSLPGALRTYLVDVAYDLLAAQHLFATARGAVAGVKCPFDRPGGVAVCKVLASPDVREKLLQVSRVLDGLRMAKSLRDVGTIDLRRFIEALTNSRAIADLDQTPGLVLRQWRVELIDGARLRSGELLDEVSDLVYLLDPSIYVETGPDLAELQKRVDSARRLLFSQTGRVLLGSDARNHVQRMLDVLRRPVPALPGRPATPDAPLDLAAVRKTMLEIRTAWADQDVAEAVRRLKELESTARGLRVSIDSLETAVYTIEATMKRFRGRGGNASPTFDIGDVPLHSVGDLRAAFVSAANALRTIKERMQKLYPGTDQAQFEFALSATVRLLGYFNLMERLARATRLTQTCSDVMSALQILGSKGANGEFVAPLYDVLEPVLASIKTHEPMSIDLLFAVIARVRLDTLVSSLQGGGDACKRDSSVDCWTVKVVHALQESVEREGTMIRVDGGKFAKRLASHGDDFRHRHKWRGYFHLTVGVGALQSKPIDDPATPDIERTRNVPLIAEQVGFGIASPSFLREHLTFKVGAAASGLLYRAVLDSQESKAIMVHPTFFAIDVANLVELYVSPLMLLVYPPSDTMGTEIRWGVSAGLSVPLSAYLERL